MDEDDLIVFVNGKIAHLSYRISDFESSAGSRFSHDPDFESYRAMLKHRETLQSFIAALEY